MREMIMQNGIFSFLFNTSANEAKTSFIEKFDVMVDDFSNDSQVNQSRTNQNKYKSHVDYLIMLNNRQY